MINSEQIETNFGTATHCIVDNNWESVVKPMIAQGRQLLTRWSAVAYIPYYVQLGPFSKEGKVILTQASEVKVFSNTVLYSACELNTGETQEITLPI